MRRNVITVCMVMIIAVMCTAAVSMSRVAREDTKTPDAVSGFDGVQLSSGEIFGDRDTYEVLIADKIGGGAIVSSNVSAAGKVVTLNVESDPGYEAASIFVISASGEQLRLDYSEGAYSFVMPNDSVIVDVGFQLKRLAAE